MLKRQVLPNRRRVGRQLGRAVTRAVLVHDDQVYPHTLLKLPNISGRIMEVIMNVYMEQPMGNLGDSKHYIGGTVHSAVIQTDRMYTLLEPLSTTDVSLSPAASLQWHTRIKMPPPWTTPSGRFSLPLLSTLSAHEVA